MTQVPTRTLGDGTTLPAIGFGTYPLTGEDGVRAIVSALEAGYRLLDTAVNYGNEAEVGEAIRRSGVPRDEIVVQTKVPGRDHAHDRAIASVEGSLERLGLEQVDVAVIHWPNPSVGLYVDAYRALVECRERGLVRSVGVSNFTEQHLADVIEATGVTPVLNQVEPAPALPAGASARGPRAARDRHRGVEPARQAQRPLRRRPGGRRRGGARRHAGPGDPALARAGSASCRCRSRRTPSGSAPTSTSSVSRASPDEVSAISALARDDGRLFGGDPDTHEEM